jgi:hypothetical protein
MAPSITMCPLGVVMSQAVAVGPVVEDLVVMAAVGAL